MSIEMRRLVRLPPLQASHAPPRARKTQHATTVASRLSVALALPSYPSQALATAMALGKALKKKAVLANNCFGFIGNRMLEP